MGSTAARLSRAMSYTTAHSVPSSGADAVLPYGRQPLPRSLKMKCDDEFPSHCIMVPCGCIQQGPYTSKMKVRG